MTDFIFDQPITGVSITESVEVAFDNTPHSLSNDSNAPATASDNAAKSPDSTNAENITSVKQLDNNTKASVKPDNKFKITESVK